MISGLGRSAQAPSRMTEVRSGGPTRLITIEGWSTRAAKGFKWFRGDSSASYISGMQDFELRVSTDPGATDGEVQGVRQAFLAIDDRVVIVERERGKGADASSLPWVVAASGPLALFLGTLAKKGAEATVDGLRRLVSDLYEAHRNRRDGLIVLDDESTGRRYLIDKDVPREALAELVTHFSSNHQPPAVRPAFRWSELDEQWVLDD